MNIELHEHLMRVTVDTVKRETDKLKAELAKEKDRNYALDNETFQLTHELSELHEANGQLTLAKALAVADRDAYRDQLAKCESDLELHRGNAYRLARECIDARAALKGAGYELTPSGEWKPPLGKRPDFEGVDLIAAAMAHVDAQRKLFDAADEYKARPK